MAILTEFTLNYATKTINHVSGSSRYTVRELYSHIMDLMDDAGNMDDTVPIKANTPTEFELINGWTFGADSDLGYLYGGSIVINSGASETIWANFYTLGTIAAGSVVYWMQGTSLVASEPTYTSGHIDQLIKVKNAGTLTSSGAVTAFIRNLGDSYDHFQVTATATGGRNPVPLATATDGNDDAGTASDGGINITFGTTSQDIGDGAGAKNYDVLIDGNGLSTAAVYKALKYRTRRQNTTAVGTGSTAEGRFYQLANGSYAAVKTAPFGSYAGGKFFGARGVYLTNVSDPMQRQLIDAAGVTRTPPVSMSVVITNVVSGDRVIMARSTGGVINKSQFTIGSVTANTVVATVAIPTDIPTTGVIRIGDSQYTYTGKSGSTFTGVSPSPEGKANGFYVPLIDDAASGTTIGSSPMTYVSDFEVVYYVRKKGILPFENIGVVGSAGLTVSAIRTPDPIAI